MSELARWREDGLRLGWKMPTAPRWKRMWGIRHIRTIWASIKVDIHERRLRDFGFGMWPSGYDQWVLDSMWHGEERGDE